MFYAERVNPKTCEIEERGVFLSISEFADYRRLGWSGAAAHNDLADALIKEQDAAEVPERMTAEEFAAMQEAN